MRVEHMVYECRNPSESQGQEHVGVLLTRMLATSECWLTRRPDTSGVPLHAIIILINKMVRCNNRWLRQSVRRIAGRLIVRSEQAR